MKKISSSFGNTRKSWKYFPCKKGEIFQMLLILLSCIPFFLFFFIIIIIIKPASRKSFPPLLYDMTLLLVLLFQEFIRFLIHWMNDCRLQLISQVCELPLIVSTKKKCSSTMVDVVAEEDAAELNILDLPELALESILTKLPAEGLLSMACACRTMRDVCRNDHLWERHMQEKWGKLLGPALVRKWQSTLDSRKDTYSSSSRFSGGLPSEEEQMSPLYCLWPLSWLKPKFETGIQMMKCSTPPGSVMSFYSALEKGKLSFPAQVYNRENGHVGFMLSCYDAEVCYDRVTDTFRARYPPHGQRPVKLEEGVQWHRLRAPPFDTDPHDLHVSDCLRELRPGEHVEIQWRKSKEFPYGWWYGVVGHLSSCDKNELHCLCHQSDIIMLEFNQYAYGSQWRQALISRKEHQEAGNETDGFYGRIRKLRSKDEISTWRRLWPNEVLD